MSFDGPAYVQHVAKRLVSEFEFSAGAGTPGLIGAAKEHPARAQLEKLLPDGIAVGSGLVVDSYGGVSKQQDIIVYEKLAPVFTHNGTAEATYYPVEGVVAVGEVKTTLGKQELADVFAKSQSVKKLRRHAVADPDGIVGIPTVAFRSYGSTTSLSGTKDEEFNQVAKSLHQVCAFALCEKFGTSAQTLLGNAGELYKSGGVQFGPNFIASLKDGFIAPHKSHANSIVCAAKDADGLMFCDQPADAFAQLLMTLRHYVNAGKTVERSHYERYFKKDGKPSSFRLAARVQL